MDIVDTVENRACDLEKRNGYEAKCRYNRVLPLSVYFCRKKMNRKRNPQPLSTKNVDKAVDNVHNYREIKDSATLTISPAPIVINKSPGTAWSNKNFSISSKE